MKKTNKVIKRKTKKPTSKHYGIPNGEDCGGGEMNPEDEEYMGRCINKDD